MSISNHTELVAQIKSWANRSDNAFDGEVQGFIALAERRIYDGNEDEGSDPLRVKELEADTTISFTNGVGSLPADFLEMRALTRDNDQTGLDYLSPQRFEVMKAELTSGGNPGYYTIKQGNVELAPGWTGSLDCHYYQELPELTTGANAVLTNYDNIYLWAALIEALTWVENDTRAALFRTRYNGAVRGANTKNGRGIRSGVAKKLQIPITQVV